MLWLLEKKMFSGFVFYEGDCFQRGRNPYIPLDIDNPTCAQAGFFEVNENQSTSNILSFKFVSRICKES